MTCNLNELEFYESQVVPPFEVGNEYSGVILMVYGFVAKTPGSSWLNSSDENN